MRTTSRSGAPPKWLTAVLVLFYMTAACAEGPTEPDGEEGPYSVSSQKVFPSSPSLASSLGQSHAVETNKRTSSITSPLIQSIPSIYSTGLANYPVTSASSHTSTQGIQTDFTAGSTTNSGLQESASVTETPSSDSSKYSSGMSQGTQTTVDAYMKSITKSPEAGTVSYSELQLTKTVDFGSSIAATSAISLHTTPSMSQLINVQNVSTESTISLSISRSADSSLNSFTKEAVSSSVREMENKISSFTSILKTSSAQILLTIPTGSSSVFSGFMETSSSLYQQPFSTKISSINLLLLPTPYSATSSITGSNFTHKTAPMLSTAHTHSVIGNTTGVLLSASPSATLQVYPTIISKVLGLSSYSLQTPFSGVANSTIELSSQVIESSRSENIQLSSSLPSISVCDNCENITESSVSQSAKNSTVVIQNTSIPLEISSSDYKLSYSTQAGSSPYYRASLVTSVVQSVSSEVTPVMSSAASVISSSSISSGAPTAPPQNVVAYNLSSTSILVAWQQPPPGTLNGILHNYEVYIKKVSPPAFTPAVTPTAVLSKSTTVFSHTGVVTSVTPSSEIVTRSYKSMSPSLVSVTATSAQSGPITEPSSTPHEPTREPTVPPWAFAQVPISAGLGLNITIDQLEIWTWYEVRVRAVTTSPGPFSPAVTVQTDEDVPAAPHYITVMSLNSSALAVSWGPPDKPNGILHGYTVSYKVNGSHIASSLSVGLVTQYIVTQLVPYTVYVIQVAAFTGKGHGDWKSILLQTPEGRPTSPRNFTASTLTPFAIQLTWEPSQSPNGHIKYRLYQRPASSNQSADRLIYEDVVPGFEAGSLSAYTQYVFTVYACNLVDCNLASEPTIAMATTQPAKPSGPPLDVRALAISSRSILVKWKPADPSDWNGPMMRYQVTFYPPHGPHSMQNTSGTSASLLVMSLTPYTMYYFTVRMANIIGVGPASEVVSNITYEDAPSPPTKVNVVTTSSTSVRVTWSKPLYPNGALIKYRLYVRLSRDNVSANQLAYDGEDDACLVQKLEEYHEYSFTVTAYNGKTQETSQAVVVTQTTHPAAPTAPPQNVTISYTSSSSIRVTWQPPKASEINGKLTGYIVSYNISTTSVVNITVPWNKAEVLITKLRSYTGYYVTVQAVNGVGAGPASGLIYGRTLEDVPGPPILDEVRNLSSTVLLISWLRPVRPNGVMNGFKVCWNHLPSGNTSCKYTGGASRTLNVTKVLPYSDYNISVSASTSIGYGPAVSGVYRTEEGVPSQPLHLVAWNTSSESVYASWSTPSTINGKLNRYQVYYSRNGSSSMPKVAKVGLSLNVTLKVLAPYTIYDIQVRACTRKGCSGPVKITVSTDEGVPNAVASVTVSQRGVRFVQLKWSAPSKPNGLIGYLINYWPALTGHAQKRITIPHGLLSHVVLLLEPYVNYTFAVVPFNLRSKLEGPAKTVTVRTLVAAPAGPPLGVTLIQTTSSSLAFQWRPPDKPNGPIIRYHIIYYDIKKPADKRANWTTETKYTILGLSPWHLYAVETLCESDGGVGPSSELRTYRTSASEPPTIGPLKPPAKTDVSAHEIVIELVKASNVNGPISCYQVIVLELRTDKDGLAIRPPFAPDHYKPKDLLDYYEAKGKLVPYISGEFDASEFDLHHTFVVGQGNDSMRARRRRDGVRYFNGPLVPGTYYSVFQRAYVTKDLYTSGAWIDPVSTKEASEPASGSGRSSGNSGLVVGLAITFAGLIAILIFVVIFIWRKRRFDFGVMLDDNGDYTGRSLKLKKLRRRRTSNKGLMGSTDSLDAIDELSRNRRRRQPIPVESFATHVRRMHTDGDIGFSEEYELVQPNDEAFTWHHSLHPANKYKNRYANIVAYDHSRVLLTPIEGAAESEYINANYIDGYDRSSAFIATQGPLPETFDDFWRMIWEQGSAVIVMLTQLEERGRRKCDQYWPDRGTRNYGSIRVTASETFHMSYYVLRTFILSHMQEEEEPRQVRQYHYTSWPDHGVPSHPAPLLSMVRTVSNANPATAGPMVVHCSAGVGRTGTFITLDCMLRRIAQEGTIDVFGFVKQMRDRRNLMVQTETQYVFIHDALLEAVVCGVTEVEANKLASRIRELREVDPNIGFTYMDKEFERLTKEERHPSTFKNANLGCNTLKNRYANILPYERTRVPLTMRPGEVGSDYINASFIDGNCRLKVYIASQAPVPNTFQDFWRMIWEQESSVIVMLTREEEAGKLKCHRYWPSDGSRMYDKILVELTEELTYSDYVVRHFSLTHAEEKTSRTVRQFQYTDWPDTGLPESGVGLIDLIGQVEKWQQQSGNTCITVHCSGGVGRTGVFCAVSILIERVKAEGVIDVFQTVQHLRLQRPAMVQTKDQYEFCYTTMQEYLESFDLYANFQ